MYEYSYELYVCERERARSSMFKINLLALELFF